MDTKIHNFSLKGAGLPQVTLLLSVSKNCASAADSFLLSVFVFRLYEALVDVSCIIMLHLSCDLWAGTTVLRNIFSKPSQSMSTNALPPRVTTCTQRACDTYCKGTRPFKQSIRLNFLVSHLFSVNRFFISSITSFKYMTSRANALCERFLCS